MNQNENFMKYFMDDDDDAELSVEEDADSLGESDQEESGSTHMSVKYDDLHEQDLERRLVYAKTVFFVVLMCQGLETIALFSILSNLVIFLNMIPLLWSNNNATSMYFSTIFIFFLSVSVSAFLAELYIQPKSIIIWSYIFYLIGSCFMTFTAFGQHQLADRDKVEYNDTLVLEICGNLNRSNVTSFICGSAGNNCRPLVDVALVFFAMGSGVLNYHLPFFTFQQLWDFGISPSYFFGWHALVFVIGATLAIVVVTFVQFNVNFFFGYLIGLSCLSISFLLFILLLPAFEKVELRYTYIKEVKDMFKYASSDIAAQRQKQYCVDGQCPSRLSMAMEKYQGPSRENLVREVRIFLRMLPVFFSLAFFWLLSFQACTSYVIQGVHMRLYDPNLAAVNATNSDSLDNGFVFPPTWMFSSSFVTILLLIPLEYFLTKPAAERMKLRKLKSPTVKITTGLILLMISFVIAGILEYVRVTRFKDCMKKNHLEGKCVHSQLIGITFYYATDLHISWQIPQFVSMTLGQMLTLTGIFKFAYNESSNDTRGFVMSAFFFMCGVGAILALLCLDLANILGFFCGDENKDYCNPNYAKMYVYFWILATIQLFGIFVFLLAMKTYVNFKKYDRAFPLFRIQSYLDGRAASAGSDTLN